MKNILLLLFLAIFLSACVEQIDFDVERQGGQLVIDGRMTDEAVPQRLKLGVTASSDRIPSPISSARVQIFDDQGRSETYVQDAEEPGTYILPGNKVMGKPGRTYYIEFELQDGRTYRSVPEKMPEQAGKLDSITYDFSTEQTITEASVIIEKNYINAYIDVDLSDVTEEPFFLRWDVEEVFLLSPTDFPDPFNSIPPPCYVFIYAGGTKLNLFDGSKNSARSLDKLQVASRQLDFGFREKHTFSVYQRSLSREAFAYWEKVDKILSNVGNIFDTPPAPIPGNIYNVNDPDEEVLGYFEVAASTVIRFSTYRFNIPVDQILECEYSIYKRYRDYPPYCLDCRSLRNSSYERPDFF